MKKLMTMIAAVATAFGLFAAVDPDDTGTSFEGATANETLASQTNVIQELPDFQATTLTYWANLDDTAVIKTRDVAFANRPLQYKNKGNTYCLELATGTKVIERYAKADGGKTEIKNGNLFFDSVVNMTAFEDAPTIPADAKIAVWLQEAMDENDEPSATNLVVTINGEDYIADGNWESILENWARVTVKALKLGNGKIGFVVFVNSTIVTCTDLAYDMTGYNDNAKQYAGMKALFPFAGEDTKITAAGFAGKGSIDDLVFTKTAPNFDYADDFKFFTLGWDTTSVASVEDFASNPTNLLVDGLQKTYTYVAQEGYINGSTNITGVAGQTYTITAAKLAATVLKWDESAEDWKPVEGGYVSSFAAALALVDNSGKFKIELGQDEGAITIDKACDLTLDLAGNTIAATNEEVPAIWVTAGALTIVDSSNGDGKVQGIKTSAEEVGEFYTTAVDIAADDQSGDYLCSVTINAGTFDGATTATAINGGKFSAKENDGTLTDNIPEGAEWAQKDGYFYLKMVTDFTVTVPEAEDNTTLAVTINGEDAGDTNGVYTVAKASTLKAVYTADEGYELNGQGEWTVTYATRDTVIIAPTAEQIMVDFTVAEVTGATLLAVSNGTEEVIADQGKYTVPTNATVTLYYAPAAGYKLTKTTAEVTIDTADQVVDVSGEIAPAQITYVAQIGDDPTKKFETLAEAVDALTADDQTIKLLANTALTAGVTPAFNTTFDFGGYTLDCAGVESCVVVSEGKVLSVTNGTIEISTASYSIRVYGTLNVLNGARVTQIGSTCSAIDVNDKGVVNVEEGAYLSAKGQQVFRCKGDAATHTINIKGGEIVANGHDFIELYKDGSVANVTISGGKIYQTGDVGKYAMFHVEKQATMNVTITGGELSATNANFRVDGEDGKIQFTKLLDNTCAAKFYNDQGLNDYCADGYKAKKSEGSEWYTIQAIQYATLAVNAEAGITYTLTNKTTEAVVEAGYRADIDNAEVIEAIELGFEEGYELDVANSTTSVTLDAAETKTIVLKKQLKTYVVTFSTNNVEVVEEATTAQHGQAPAKIPSFTGGTWDVDPTTAEITCATNFNYTIQDTPTPDPVNPGEEKNYDTEKEAQDAAKNINDHKDTMINVPTQASGDKAAYLARVEAKVNGTKVVVDIAEGQEATFKSELDTEIKKTTVAAALTDASATKVTITTVAGFYYWVEGGVEVGAINTNGDAVIGDGSAIELTKPALGTTTKAFYKLAVGVKDPASTPKEDK